MAKLPDIYLLQGTRKNLELAKSFQGSMSSNFFDYAIFDIKDALTSILAICDMEDMKQVPAVKKYIKTVTNLLTDARSYQNLDTFNVNFVLINAISVLKNHYKDKLELIHEISLIKALVIGDRSKLETFVLYVLRWWNW